jgi:protein transport protein SEC20
MPPIPVTLDEQTRLSMESLQRRINDLVKFQIPRLRQCTGPLAIQQRLNAEVRDDIDACTQQVEVSFSAIYSPS